MFDLIKLKNPYLENNNGINYNSLESNYTLLKSSIINNILDLITYDLSGEYLKYLLEMKQLSAIDKKLTKIFKVNVIYVSDKLQIENLNLIQEIFKTSKIVMI